MHKTGKVTAIDFNKNSIEVDIDKLTWRPAAYGIVIDGKKILLSKQTNGYNLPGGGINFGENPLEAVIREIKEETGITASNPRLIEASTYYFTSRSKQEVTYQAVALYYVCDFQPGSLSADGLEDYEKEFTEGPVWLAIEELNTAQIGAANDFRDIIKKAQKL
ncbi:MAG TPA: NUDIX domain-containing protein [Candidatus Saccharimonadales bacterium]|nr:NUDIX domain-containing protein [Candidatus Saccharimonadales bacterium]